MTIHGSGRAPDDPLRPTARPALPPSLRRGLLHWLMFTILLLTVPAFYLELDAVDPTWRHAGALLYALVAAAFFFDLTFRRRIHRDPDHDRKWSIWLDAAIVVGAAGSALSGGAWSETEWGLRSVLLIVIVLRLLVFLRRLFSAHDIVYLLGLGAGMLALAGGGFYWLEPTVHSYADGLWLAFESGATVGYGDILPTTPSSRLFAAFMVLLGYALMSLVTGAIAAAFVGEDEKRLRRELHDDIKRLRDEVAQLRAQLPAPEDSQGNLRGIIGINKNR
jgi:voltage-gated potassium channel